MTKPNKKRGFRKIVVNDTEFSWCFKGVIDIRTAKNKNNRMIVDFGWYDIWLFVNDLVMPPEYNPKIITPKFVADSIKYALKKGWDTNSKSCEFKIRFRENKYSVIIQEFDPRIRKQKWNQSELGQITFEKICRLFSSNKKLKLENHPPHLRRYYVKNEKSKYAIGWDRYENNVEFSGLGVARTDFILQGKCEVKTELEICQFELGDYFEIPTSEYHFAVMESPFEYVSVYELPEDFSFARVNKSFVE